MRTLSFILSFLITNIAFAKEQVEPILAMVPNHVEDNKAELVFKTKVKDLGEINFAEENTFYFEFKNEGNAPLKIMEVFADGEYAEIQSFSTEVGPGGSGWLRIKFESEDHIGSFSEYFFVRSNSGGSTTLSRLEVKYELFEYINIGGDNVAADDKVNIRATPELDSKVLFQLPKGKTCKLVGDDIGDYVEKFDDAFWYKIDHDGRVGWVLSSLTEF